jgi:hypothetical protein
MTNNLFQSARERVLNSPSTIFSQQDVLALINYYENIYNSTPKPDPKEDLPNLDKIFEMVTEEVNSVLGNFSFDDITSVDLCDREITLDYDASPLMEDIETAIDNLKSQLTKK